MVTTQKGSAKGNAARKQERVSKNEYIYIGVMRVSENAQRPYRAAHAEAMAENFDLEAMGYPVLSYRDGVYWIVDGQHRIRALEMAGFSDYKIECEVYRGLTEQEEALLFLVRDDRRAITPIDKFRIAVFGGREPESTINRIVERQGLRVSGSGSHTGAIQAANALMVTYEEVGAAKLGRTLHLLKESFEGEPKAFTASMIRAMSLVVYRYDKAMDDEHLIQALASMKGGVNQLEKHANVLNARMGQGKIACIAAAIVERNNDGTRGRRRLDIWWT